MAPRSHACHFAGETGSVSGTRTPRKCYAPSSEPGNWAGLGEVRFGERLASAVWLPSLQSSGSMRKQASKQQLVNVSEQQPATTTAAIPRLQRRPQSPAFDKEDGWLTTAGLRRDFFWALGVRKNGHYPMTGPTANEIPRH